jgi:hypothetical protein
VEFFDHLSRMANGETEEVWQSLLEVDRLSGDEETGRALRGPALRMLTAAAETITTLATQAWGDPEFTLTSGPRKKPPEWMELYLYPNGVPVSLHYLAGWRRERRRGKRRQEVAALVYIDEDHGGGPAWWRLNLNLGLHDF